MFEFGKKFISAVTTRLNKKRSANAAKTFAAFNKELYNFPYLLSSWSDFSAAGSNFFEQNIEPQSDVNMFHNIGELTGIYKLNWWNTDTLENYKKRGNTKYSQNCITYTIDDAYFRRYNKWGGKKTVACFGCSNTVGIGLPDHETWVYQLNKNIGFNEYTCRNYGMCGASADTISRFISIYLDNSDTTPDTIVCLFPDIFRFEYISSRKKRHTNFCTSITLLQGWYIPEYDYIRAMTNEYFALSNFAKNIKFIEALCASRNIKFIWHTWSELVLNLDTVHVQKLLGTGCLIEDSKLVDPYSNVKVYHDMARDGLHFGEYYNRSIAQAFAKKFLSL